ncbi:hypothetical protein RBSWK_04109 [Rhodopirellula baltica SWK14]|uniref:Uncharacterized protein n=1 Tax=Rhodopirellula baltica SWK14 TaxID=993516 RepID=L7CCM8_RHOBT|nr:hypothetical protein RBSWK_04109 [Rhodopirellula baltica SWK14]
MRSDVCATLPICVFEMIQELEPLSWSGIFLQPASGVNENVTLG